jgi:hypothetical protein
MKKKPFTVLLCIMLLTAMTGYAKSVILSKAVLKDKIMGGWAGQTIGCTYGGPTEFVFQGRMIPDSVQIKWPEHHCKWYYDEAPGLYDDLYMDLTFVDVFERKGLDADVSDFADAFAHAGYSLWHANQSARYNILQGVIPPESGYWKNNPHADDIDFQIEADFSGLMSPGMPNTAIHYGDKIGHMITYGDGWYGGVFIGAMYALSFVKDDINDIVSEALKAIPQQSTFYACMADVIKGYRLYPHDWKKTWQIIQDKYAYEVGCPEGVYSPLDIDAKMNSAYIVIGLLYGQKDFGKVLDISTRCGQDSDCNPSSAGGILGTILGYTNIPDNWKKPLKEVEDRPFQYTDISLNKVYEIGIKQALEVILRNGGQVMKDVVKIKIQKPMPVRFEQSFSGLEPSMKKEYNNIPIDKVGEIKFNGCGIVIRGDLSADDKAYVGLVDVYIDGRKVDTVSLPAAYHDRSNDIYWNYDLPEGDHVLTMKRINPQDNVSTKVYSIIVYKKAQKNIVSSMMKK